MRLSVRKNDSGYHKRAYKFQTFLNGKKIDSCFTADDIEGFCDVHVKDSAGCCIIDGNHLKSARLFGNVEIVRSK